MLFNSLKILTQLTAGLFNKPNFVVSNNTTTLLTGYDQFNNVLSLIDPYGIV